MDFMDDTTNIEAVLAAYPHDCQPTDMEHLGSAGGMSGATFWRLMTHQGELCLRRWPTSHPTQSQLGFIHAVLFHAVRHGFQTLPVPLRTNRGRSYVSHAGNLWELTAWLPGKAYDFRSPNFEKLRSAVIALAEFHLAVSSFPRSKTGHTPSPGILDRYRKLDWLMGGGIDTLHEAVNKNVWSEMMPRAERLLDIFPHIAPAVADHLRSAARLKITLQPCLRDIHSDHVLFSNSQVSGFIDFGAMRYETVAGDIARLLGSMTMGSEQPDTEDRLKSDWHEGLAAYQSVRPLSQAERSLVSTFDRSGLLISGIHWLEWTYIDQRVFENRTAVLARMDRILSRLQGHLSL